MRQMHIEQDVCVVFSIACIRSTNSARMNKPNFTKKIMKYTHESV